MPEILLIEPSSSDAVLMKEALRETEAGVTVVRTGADALAYLDAKGPEARGMPDLVLYSLEQENADAVRALSVLKSGEITRRIPVVVLARLDTAAARQRWYDLHANCVIPRPTSYDQFRRVVQSIERFWFSIVTLPRE